jgi:hypothetical protein
MSYEGTWSPPCAICKESVRLEDSKTDEYGRAVHENCYVWTVELKKARRRIARMDAVHERPSPPSGEASYPIRRGFG